MIKVLIADDQELIRESLKIVLGTNEDMEVTGIAENGEQVLSEIKKDLLTQVLSACRETGTCIKREPVFSYIWARSRGRQRKKQCPSTAIWPAF